MIVLKILGIIAIGIIVLLVVWAGCNNRDRYDN